MIKKRIEYTFFVILNIFLSSFLLHIYAIMYMVLALFRMVESVEKYCHVEILTEDFLWYFFIFGFPIISIILKILVFPVLYKIKFFSNIQDFLKRFATDKIFLIKVLFSVLIFDIIVYMISVFLSTKQLDIYEIQEGFISYLFVFLGVLPCYLSFLLWYKITHRKKKTTNN